MGGGGEGGEAETGDCGGGEDGEGLAGLHVGGLLRSGLANDAMSHSMVRERLEVALRAKKKGNRSRLSSSDASSGRRDCRFGVGMARLV